MSRDPGDAIRDGHLLHAIDGAWIDVRKIADGVVQNAQGVQDFNLNDGLINIQYCPAFALAINFSLGGLTNVTITPEFSDAGRATWYQYAAWTTAIGSTVDVDFTYTANASKLYILPNPGAMFLRFQVESTGTVTSSTLRVRVGRIGCPTNPMIFGV